MDRIHRLRPVRRRMVRVPEWRVALVTSLQDILSDALADRDDWLTDCDVPDWLAARVVAWLGEDAQVLAAACNRIDHLVDQWHNDDEDDRELHEALGWTWGEYKAYVESGVVPERDLGAARAALGALTTPTEESDPKREPHGIGRPPGTGPDGNQHKSSQ